MNSPIVQVILGLPVAGPFDYICPLEKGQRIVPGMRVLVPFRHDQLTGIVVAVKQTSRIKRLRTVIRVLDNQPALTADDLSFTKDFSQYYSCSWGEAVETFLPTALRKKRALVLPNETLFAGQTRKECSQTLYLQQADAGGVSFLLEKVKQALSGHRSVIILAPEAEKMNHLRRIVEKELSCQVAVLGKQLTPKAELAHWTALRSGQARIAIGTRSAVFAPAANLGLIVIWDESHSSYKQEQTPFYHVREVARMRLAVGGGELAFICHAPSVELWYAVKQKKVALEQGAAGKQGAVQLIDLTNYKPQFGLGISYPLQTLLQNAVTQQKAVLLFLNRKGFSMMTRCNQCGEVVRCSRCQVNLTYLYSKKQLVCRLCGSGMELPEVCPNCRSRYLRYLGAGVEKLESELSRLYPFAVTEHFDRETQAFPHKAAIVVGTQAVLKHLPEQKFDLVALLDLDAELGRFDFRCSQQAFRLLTVLRASSKEKFVVQTRSLDHLCLQALKKDDPKKFYSEELALRKELGFPPFQHLVEVGIRSCDEDAAFRLANTFFEKIQKEIPSTIEVLDPQPDIRPKMRDKFRFSIMVKGRSAPAILKAVQKVRQPLAKKKGCVITVNMDA